MVSPNSSSLALPPRFIYITGCDGTGKTTQAQLLMADLAAQGSQTRHVWLRFPFLFSLPLLVYARVRGFSWYEINAGFRHGYWDFRSSWLLRKWLPWLLLVDASLAALIYIYVPLWLGKTIVCERFVLDMIVDLSVAISDVNFHKKYPGKLFQQILPPQTKIILLDLDPDTIRERRRDLEGDRNLEARLHYYRILRDDLSLTEFSSQMTVEEISGKLIDEIDGITMGG